MRKGIAMFAVLAAALGVNPLCAQVTPERIQHAVAEPQNWLTYSGTYNGQRFSTQKQIATANVSRLGVQWVFQTPVPGKFEASPLVVDGVMYFTAAENNAYAVDART